MAKKEQTIRESSFGVISILSYNKGPFGSSGFKTGVCQTRAPGNGRGGLGRIRTDFVEILKKGQEPTWTKFHFFFETAGSPIRTEIKISRYTW